MKNKIIINKDEFYHLVAKNANFTIGDVKEIWHTIEDLFAKVLEEDYILDLPGFGKLYVADVAEKNTWDNIHKKEMFVPATKRPVFKLSSNLKKITSIGKNRKEE